MHRTLFRLAGNPVITAAGTTETVLFTTTLQGGTLRAGRALVLSLVLDATNQAGGGSITMVYRTKLGGQTLTLSQVNTVNGQVAVPVVQRYRYAATSDTAQSPRQVLHQSALAQPVLTLTPGTVDITVPQVFEVTGHTTWATGSHTRLFALHLALD